MEVTKQEFFRSMSNTASESKQFLLKYVLLPAGIAGAASVAAKQFLFKQDDRTNGEASHHNGHGRKTKAKAVEKENWFFRILPIVLPLIQQVFLERKMEKKVSRKIEEEV